MTIVHAGVFFAIGLAVWPGVKISPAKVSFRGFSNETFNFSARNETADDVYDVQIPFLIGYGRHLEDNISAKVYSTGEPPEPVREDYSYCFGRGPDVHNIAPNEQEVLIVKIRHLTPNESVIFTVIDEGGATFETKAGKASFIDTPSSYSPNLGTVGVRGDYRICKIVGQLQK